MFYWEKKQQLYNNFTVFKIYFLKNILFIWIPFIFRNDEHYNDTVKIYTYMNYNIK